MEEGNSRPGPIRLRPQLQPADKNPLVLPYLSDVTRCTGEPSWSSNTLIPPPTSRSLQSADDLGFDGSAMLALPPPSRTARKALLYLQ